MTDSGYRLPPTRAEAQERRDLARAQAEHEPARRAAAERDRRREAMRSRPARIEVTPAIRKGLLERAHVEAELKFRLRAIAAGQHACVETKQHHQRRRAEIEPQLQSARRDASRAKIVAEQNQDPTRAGRYVEALDRIEAQARECDEIVAEMLAEQRRLSERANEITAVLAPLRERIDAACARLGRSRSDLGIAIDLDPHFRGQADIVVPGR